MFNGWFVGCIGGVSEGDRRVVRGWFGGVSGVFGGSSNLDRRVIKFVSEGPFFCLGGVSGVVRGCIGGGSGVCENCVPCRIVNFLNPIHISITISTQPSPRSFCISPESSPIN